MVEVAQVGGDGTDLEFLEANFSIWPSEGTFACLSVLVLYTQHFLGHTPHDGFP